MKKNLLVTAAALAFMTSSVLAAYSDHKDFAVSTKIIPVKLVRGDQVEYGRLVYRAWVHKDEQQTGGSSKPFKGKLVDDRQCHWAITGHMSRQYFVTSITGKEDSQPASSLMMDVAVSGKSNGLANVFDHDPCSDLRGKIDATIATAKKDVLAKFDTQMAQDIEVFSREMTGISVVINP